MADTNFINHILQDVSEEGKEDNVITVYVDAILSHGINGHETQMFSGRVDEWSFDSEDCIAHIRKHVKKSNFIYTGKYEEEEFFLDTYVPYSSIVYMTVKDEC